MTESQKWKIRALVTLVFVLAIVVSAKCGHAGPLPCLTTHQIAEADQNARMCALKLLGIVLAIIFLC